MQPSIGPVELLISCVIGLIKFGLTSCYAGLSLYDLQQG